MVEIHVQCPQACGPVMLTVAVNLYVRYRYLSKANVYVLRIDCIAYFFVNVSALPSTLNSWISKNVGHAKFSRMNNVACWAGLVSLKSCLHSPVLGSSHPPEIVSGCLLKPSIRRTVRHLDNPLLRTHRILLYRPFNPAIESPDEHWQQPAGRTRRQATIP